MPFVVLSAVIATAGAAAAGAIASTAISIAALATTFFTTLVVGAVSSLLQKKPKPPEFSTRSAGLTTMVREPLSTGKVVYGTNRLSGPIVFMHTTDDNQWLHLVITLAAHEIFEVTSLYFDDELVALTNGEATDSKYLDDAGDSLVRLSTGLGTDAQTANSLLISDAPDKWTSNHRLRGNAYIYVRLGWKADLWTNGLPNISAVIKGKKLFDTRTSSTPDAVGVNPALAVYDYLRNSLYGLNVPSAEIDTASFNTAANVCEEAVSLLAGGTEDRYTVNGVIDTSATPKVVLEELLSSMAGTLTYQNGKWFIYAGEHRTPTVTLDEDDLRGGINVTTRTSRKDLFNTVRGIYIDPNSQYQPVDFPEVTNSTFVTEDNSDTIVHDTTYPFTTSAPTCQRLAKIELERVRQQIRVDLPLKLTGFQLQVGDTFNLTNSRFGWSSKIFEVETWALVLDSDENGVQIPAVNVTAKETASTVWDWSDEETTVDAAPDTNLPNPFVVSAITGLVLDSSEAHLIRGANGRIVSRIKATWDIPVDSYVTSGGFVEVYSRLSTASAYTFVAIVPGDQNFIFINDVDDRATYDVRIRPRNYAGGVGAYTALLRHTVIGKTTPPPNVSDFEAANSLGIVRFKWTALDIVDVYGYEIRYGLQGTQWQNAIPLTVAKQGTAETTIAVPPGSWSFMIKAVDYVGLFSPSASVIGPLTISNANSVLNAVAEGAWPGTLVNLVKHYTNVLAPESQSLASDHGFSTFDVYVPAPEVICTYETTEIDLGSDKNIRVWGSIDSDLGPGVTTGVANPQLQFNYRSSTDDSSGDDLTTALIETAGTFTNCILHYTGVIVPDSQSLASATGFDVFDKFVFDPFEIATYEAVEIDYSADANQILSVINDTVAGPGETGEADITVEIDTRTSSGSYDGFATFSGGTFNLRFAKMRVTINSATTVGRVDTFSLIASGWRTITIGDLDTVQFIKARIRVDTDVGVIRVDDMNWTLDQYT